MALEVQEVLQAPQRCYPEYREFLGCPVAPAAPEGLEDQGVLAQTSFFLQEILKLVVLQTIFKLA